MQEPTVEDGRSRPATAGRSGRLRATTEARFLPLMVASLVILVVNGLVAIN